MLFDFSMPAKTRVFRVTHNGEALLNERDGLPIEFAYAADASVFADRMAAFYNSSRRCFAVVPVVVK